MGEDEVHSPVFPVTELDLDRRPRPFPLKQMSGQWFLLICLTRSRSETLPVMFSLAEA